MRGVPGSIQHGTHSGYAHGCRCVECRRGHNDYAKARHASGYVDARPFTEVLGDLYRRGEDISRIAETCRVDPVTVRRVVFGDSLRILPRTAERLRQVVVMFPEVGP